MGVWKRKTTTGPVGELLERHEEKYVIAARRIVGRGGPSTQDRTFSGAAPYFSSPRGRSLPLPSPRQRPYPPDSTGGR